MRKRVAAWLVATLVASAVGTAAIAAQQTPAPAAGEEQATGEEQSSEERSSYALGLSFARSLRQQKVEVDSEQLFAGIRDGLGDGPARLTDEEVEAAVRELQQQVVARGRQERLELGEKTKAEGETFLAANAEREGVVTLPSGLQYEVLQEGDGPKPKVSDEVSVHYHGTLVDGTVFDSSRERGEPIKVRPDRVIRGWTEALPMMGVGSKWKLFIPPGLAYGENGAGASIPPHAALIFEVELLGIEAPAPTEEGIGEDGDGGLGDLFGDEAGDDPGAESEGAPSTESEDDQEEPPARP